MPPGARARLRGLAATGRGLPPGPETILTPDTAARGTAPPSARPARDEMRTRRGCSESRHDPAVRTAPSAWHRLQAARHAAGGHARAALAPPLRPGPRLALVPRSGQCALAAP